MRKLTLLFAFVLFVASTFATSKPSSGPVMASSIMLPVGKTGKTISLQDLSLISVKDFQLLTGQKMSLADRLGFKVAQRELRQSINADGTVNSKKVAKLAMKADGGGGFHLGGFALGFLLGLIGVLIAYLIKDDKKSSRVKWAWLGLLAWLVIWLVVFVI